MPRFEPFAGLRYDPSVPLDQVIAPPYDVVGPVERAELAARNRANSIHVELPVDDPRSGLDRYANASKLLVDWTDEGVVLLDAQPAFYAYRMTTPAGRTTTGVVGALGCEPTGGDILPHEETIPKDKSDRLELLRACRTNLSPIWGLSLTSGIAKAYEPQGEALARATDDDGVRHELWVIDEPASIDAIRQGVASSPVVIADGHHRYETACTYQAERRAAKGPVAGDYDLVMALVVELSEDQLAVGPIHRTISNVPEGTDLPEAFSVWFDLVSLGQTDDKTLNATGESEAFALVTRAGAWLLTPRDATYEAARSDLDSSLLRLVTDPMDGARVAYRHHWRNAFEAVSAGDADAAVLLRPVTVAQISKWAHERRRMPPKSTYFRPKPRTGMVFRPVEG